ncbi:VanZ family protein [Microbacterium lushaniae]|uniref:VanZ family protein n=1 Tax=Microbacterium lushaniae TaxID=2614639 RepID=A0A5J6L2X9_9MICO|nr:VanZ family protein [Microbacterium lushaniae]QEW02884.1 VanZ family protein [Microbacterium lushaniae]
MRVFVRGLFAVVALAVVAGLTLAPRMLVGPARRAFLDWADATTMPLLGGAEYADAERLLNTAMFVPLGAALALLLPLRGWPLAVAAGFGVSVAVEYLQAAIPGRVPDATDVVWNTVGALVGVGAVTLVRALAAAVRAQRGSVTRT